MSASNTYRMLIVHSSTVVAQHEIAWVKKTIWTKSKVFLIVLSVIMSYINWAV